MKTMEEWLSEYAESHRNPINQRIHKICVPLILWSIVGFFSLLRSPFLDGGVFASAGVLVSAFALGFYALFGLKPFAQMLVLLGLCLATCALLESLTNRAWLVYVTVFVLAWIGQAIGHVYEGKRPSFFSDLQFLLVGQLWILQRH